MNSLNREFVFDREFEEDITLQKGFFSKEMADKYFQDLLTNFNWHKVLKNTAGEEVIIPRKMGYVSGEPTTYKYANLELPGDSWNEVLVRINLALFAATGITFNSVLLNLYENGKDEIRWHSDKEEQLGPRPIIACVNLGASRIFHFGRIGEKDCKRSLLLESGDLLVMNELCQERWVHAILKEKHITEPRISLTFRTVRY